MEATFAAFTSDLSNWWPVKTHSSGGARANEIHFEARVGGRFFERFIDGEEMTIGTVTAIDAPNRVTFTWQLAKWSAPTVVDVTFTPGPEGTLVELEQRGFEHVGLSSDQVSRYGKAWGEILDKFNEAQLAK